MGPSGEGLWLPCGVNPVLKFARYRPGCLFKAHRDGPWVPGIDHMSVFTVVIYLYGAACRASICMCVVCLLCMCLWCRCLCLCVCVLGVLCVYVVYAVSSGRVCLLTMSAVTAISKAAPLASLYDRAIS